MIIQHNIMALNSYNRLSGNNSLVSKNLEKLSSGYKINRAGDDAAGLAISEKMRAQITGLTRASQNAQDGISLVQTAEGNLTEVHSMLNRMVDLATQSSNGTYDGANGVDRTNLEKEMQSLKDEINRIAESAHFNGIKLLDGSMGAASSAAVSTTQGSATIAEVVTVATVGAVTAVYDMDFTGKVSADIDGKVVDGVTITWDTDLQTTLTNLKTAYGGKAGAEYDMTVTATGVTLTAKAAGVIATDPTTDTGVTVTKTTEGKDLVPGVDGSAEVPATAATTTLDYTGKTAKNLIGANLQVGANKYQFVKTGDAASVKAGVTAIEIGETATKEQIAAAVAAKTGGTDNSDGTLTFTATELGADSKAPVVKQGGLSLQIGDTADQRVTVAVGNMNVTSLGLDAVNILNEQDANKSIDLIKTAINTVSSTRADLGAIQNRLEHTINNLATTTENMTAAESRIRDTDMAKEMMAFTKNNVLSQAAQAMLAQANQQPQQVLQLLR